MKPSVYVGPSGRADVLMQLTTEHEPPGDLGGLQRRALGRRMGSEIARDRDEDMPTLLASAPRPELAHAGLQHLIAVETRIFPQQRPCQCGNQRLRRVAEREIAGHKNRPVNDLPLATEGIQHSPPPPPGAPGRNPQPSE